MCRLGLLIFRLDVDDCGSDNDSDTLDHVAEDVDYCSPHVIVAGILVFLLLLLLLFFGGLLLVLLLTGFLFDGVVMLVN